MDAIEILRAIRDLDPGVKQTLHPDPDAYTDRAALVAALERSRDQLRDRWQCPDCATLERHIRRLERQRDSAVFAAVAGAIGIVALFVALLAQC